MNLPAVLLGIVLSTLFGAIFHFWKGGSLRRLVFLLLLSWMGFWAGHLLGVSQHWSFFKIGVLYTGMGTVGSLVFLFVGNWLSLVDVQRK